jgi:hypothetical protein
MEYKLFIYIIGIIFFLFCCFQFFIFKLYQLEKNKKEIMEHDILFSILNETIKREFTNKYKLDYELKDLVMVGNFQKELHEITKNILLAFGKEFYNQLEIYYNREYIIAYVTKTVEIMLMEFIREKKIRTK